MPVGGLPIADKLHEEEMMATAAEVVSVQVVAMALAVKAAAAAICRSTLRAVGTQPMALPARTHYNRARGW